LFGFRIEKRQPPERMLKYRITGLVAGLIVTLVWALLASGAGISSFTSLMWQSTLGSTLGIHEILILSVPLLFTGLAAAIPYRMGLWNIGGDGQMFLGAWAACAVGFSVPHLAGAPLIVCMLLAAALGGAAWALIPALARAYLGVSEIISTLLLNFIASYWMVYWAGGPWRAPQSAGGVISRMIPAQSQLFSIAAGPVLVPLGFLLALAAVLGTVLLGRSRFGYEIAIVRSSQRAGDYAGIRTRRLVATVIVIGGVLGGLGGAAELMGDVTRYGPSLTNNTGYTGVIIAVLANGSALGTLVMALIFAAIIVIGNQLVVLGASSSLVFAAFGITLAFAAISTAAARFGLVRRSREPTVAPTPAVGDQHA
jgi:simple sugar transport system permease protein